MFAGRESGDQIAGPLGIINVSGQVATSALQCAGRRSIWTDRSACWRSSLLDLAAVLSVAVGIVNLLPIPILDGGHLLFYAIEGAARGQAAAAGRAGMGLSGWIRRDGEFVSVRDLE